MSPAGAPSESPKKGPNANPMRNALKNLSRRVTRTKSGELRTTQMLKGVGSKVGKGILRAPAKGMKLARGLKDRLRKKSS